MDRRIVAIGLCLIPLSLFFSVWQSFVWQQKDLEVSKYEEYQQSLFEENKRLIARYGSATSPRLIEERAVKELGMFYPQQNQIINLRLKPDSVVRE